MKLGKAMRKIVGKNIIKYNKKKYYNKITRLKLYEKKNPQSTVLIIIC